MVSHAPKLTPRTAVRLQGKLLARLQTVQLLKMREGQIAELLSEVEKDPLFQKLLYPSRPDWKVIRYQPYPRTHLSSSFYELDDYTLPSQAPPEAGELLERNKDVVAFIQRMGRKKFERYFL